MPKVSICVPAYQNPEGIKRLLASVKEQTFTDYEVIVTDDSPDDSVEAVAKAAGIKNLIYQKNEARLGAAHNWNAAVHLASGDYIKMMHHDDWFADRDSLARFAALLDGAPEAMLAFSGTWQVTLPDKERFARGISKEQESLIRKDWRNLFLGNYIGAPSATIYRRNEQEYEPQLKWLVDAEYYMRLLRERAVFACTTKPLVCIGISDSQLTEQCRTDGRLNVFEYGFLYQEFGLAQKKEYRDKLIQVALSYRQPYAELERYGISKEEYKALAQQKKRADFRFLLGVAKKKLLRK